MRSSGGTRPGTGAPRRSRPIDGAASDSRRLGTGPAHRPTSCRRVRQFCIGVDTFAELGRGEAIIYSTIDGHPRRAQPYGCAGRTPSLNGLGPGSATRARSRTSPAITRPRGPSNLTRVRCRDHKSPMNARPTTIESRSTGQAATAGTILCVGAAGAFAGLVVPELAKRGAHVRGLIRDPAQGEAVRNRGAAEIVVGDLSQRRSVDGALEGVESVFYIAPAFIPDEAEVGKSMVAAARRAGVRRFVFSSVIDPVISALVNHDAKAPVEEAIIESGMEFVLLQPAMFVQNIAGGWPGVVKTGVFAEPWSNGDSVSRGSIIATWRRWPRSR